MAMIFIPKPIIDESKILEAARNLIGEDFVNPEIATDGADHIVYKIKTTSLKNFVIKTGPDAATDIHVLMKLERHNFKVPQVLHHTKIQQEDTVYPLFVMTSFSGTALKDIEPSKKYLYIKLVLDEFKKFRSIKTPARAGYIIEVDAGKDWPWKEFLMRNINGENPAFDWQAVLQHKNIDRELLKKAMKQAEKKISTLGDNLELSLLHTDVNEANIFVKEEQLEGIIDWSDAKYGDWIFDFARFRMNIRHRMDDAALKEYSSGIQFSDAERQRERIYYLLNVLDYTNWYVVYGWDEMVTIQMDLLREIQREFATQLK